MDEEMFQREFECVPAVTVSKDPKSTNKKSCGIVECPSNANI